MRKRYADLDLKKIRDECGLDFARHTYSKHQCSCCYGPLDMAAKWWAKGKKPKKIHKTYREDGSLAGYEWDRPTDNISYILFKNASNTGGAILSMDEEILDNTCIRYHFTDDTQKCHVCEMLQEQLGNGYVLDIPDNSRFCIVIREKEKGKNL